MPRAFTGVARLLVAVGVVALLQPLTTMVEAGDSAGRDFSGCVKACNAAREACNDRANATCQGMFPNDTAARDACITAAKDLCVDESKDCKLVCKAIKNDESPEIP